MRAIGVETASDASGAVEAAKKGRIVAVVDVIDMSTTLETALEEGALAIFGASPDNARVPVFVNPEKIGYYAGSIARMYRTGLVLAAEPRIGNNELRMLRASLALRGVKRAGAELVQVVPNTGAETAKEAVFKGMVVLAVTGSGGVAFDAAFNAGGLVTTATIARTGGMKGKMPALTGARRIIDLARFKKSDICVVAASSNSIEDILAVRYIACTIQFLLSEKTSDISVNID